MPRIEAAPEKKAVTELKQKLAQQKDTLSFLQKENDVLLKQVGDLKSGTTKNETKVTQQLAEAQKNAAALQAANEKLQSERASLAKQLADASKPSGTESGRTKELESQLKAAGSESAKNAERLRKLETERASIEQENKDLKSKLDSAGTASKKSDAKKIKDLEQETEDLKQRVTTLTKDLNRRSTRGAGRDPGDLGRQIETLRARLDVLEARQIPYTPEELALLKQPEPTLAAADPKAGKKSLKEIPAGAGALVAEAQRAFATRRFEDAEKKYLEVLRQDEKNTYTLANLAAIQLELDKIAEAEKHLNQARALDADDAFTLYVSGILEFRRKNYDAALDALSRSAKLNPESHETFNLLGMTLSEKGLRGPAETAFRKALQLQPKYPNAHYNLAVAYAAHQPPSMELARWHYDRAIALGHPRTPELEKIIEAKKTDAGSP